jgi:hypothetical protein
MSSCCGRQRASQTRSTGLRAARRPVPPSPTTIDGVAFTYRGPVPMALPSPSGGPPYVFDTAKASVMLAAADAEILRRTGWFEPVTD